MKQNITLSLDRQLLKKARAPAVRRNTSVTGLLAGELERLAQRVEIYERSRSQALAFSKHDLRLVKKQQPSHPHES
jgi:hypothetical protein